MRKENKKTLYVTIVIIVLVIVSAYYNNQSFKGHINNSMVGTRVHDNIKLKDINSNETISLHEIISGDKHKYSLISFVSSWCSLCHKQHINIAKIREKYPDLGIYAVIWQDSAENILDYASHYPLGYSAIYSDINNGLSEQIGVFALPANLLISADGEVKLMATGVINDAIVKKYIEPLLTEHVNVK